ncbi:hypothetical protein Bp8pC_041 [Bacillus phage Bp8p-C]|uniref:Uncharacterized protein n=2 Tax=Agatevirus Bp8pC TaxID=1910937 RepID=A0A0A0PLF9_9CAUD|nr:hypothetical protein AXJ20_gp041 [Bacillus phage Bp8p-C]YP_009784342.1 hypothetical protein QLX39_gp041 [Bacillus phage Bp8p-T]AHJ87472.1 hypothetical protein Bp8pC_041 [Bacillus phage Bp8p-C]AHJ87683.1 hypothetical protein Bp8pT_041 [Bacillus phage Bp8p-T]
MKLTPEMFEILPTDHPRYGRATREALAFFSGFKPAITMDYLLYRLLLEDNVGMDHLLHEVMLRDDGTPYGVIFFNNEEVRQRYKDQFKETDKAEQTVMMGQLLGYPLGASKFFSRLVRGKEEQYPKITVEFSGIFFVSSRETLVEDIQYLIRKHDMLLPDSTWMLTVTFLYQHQETLSEFETDGISFSVDSSPLINFMGNKFHVIEGWVSTCFDSYHKIKKSVGDHIEEHRAQYRQRG